MKQQQQSMEKQQQRMEQAINEQKQTLTQQHKVFFLFYSNLTLAIVVPAR